MTDDDFELPSPDYPGSYLADDFEFEGFDDDAIEQLANEGNTVIDAERSLNIAQAQIGRRLVPREIEAVSPYIAAQAYRSEPIDVRAALDGYYADNPKQKPLDRHDRRGRRELMAAAIEAANPQAPAIQPPGELPAGASDEQKREHRRARMAWAMEVDRQQRGV